MLCASGPRDAAKAPPNMKYTMFSSVFLDILERGSTDLPERFSLVDLGLRTEAIMQERFTDGAVRPQVLSPDQSVGDVAKLAIFPNLGLGVRKLSEGLSRLEDVVSNLTRAQEALETEHLSLKARLDSLGSVTTNAAPSDLPKVSDPQEDFNKFLLFKFPWLRSTGLTKAQWDSIPGWVKRDIINYQKRARNGRFWLYVCLMVATSAWVLSIFSLSLLALTLYRLLADVLIAGCGFMAALHLLSAYMSRRREIDMVAGSPDTETSPDWENYDAVIEARDHAWRGVFGLELEKNAFSLSQLIYLVTFLGTLLIRLLQLIPLNR